MSGLDTFFIAEEFEVGAVAETDIHETAAGTVILPTRTGKKARRPIDPGYVLGWDEWRADDPGTRWRRRGLVFHAAPNAETYWVIPDESRDGEGSYVVVRGVVSDDDSGAHRIVGGPGDFRSTPQWQSPRTLLPRPFQRVARVTSPDGSVTHEIPELHGDPACTGLPPFGAGNGWMTEVGPPVRVEGCYLFEGALHPMSIRPMTTDGRWVPACFRCVRSKLPD